MAVVGDEGSDGGDAALCPSPYIAALVNEWAYAAEVLLHGNPSGLDNTVSTYGNIMRYSRDTAVLGLREGGVDRMTLVPQLTVLITNTKIPRSTKDLVGRVGSLYSRHPQIVKPIFDAIHGISCSFWDLARSEANDPVHFAETMRLLIDWNQMLLCMLHVSHPSIEDICGITKAAGLSSKLTGAGAVN